MSEIDSEEILKIAKGFLIVGIISLVPNILGAIIPNLLMFFLVKGILFSKMVVSSFFLIFIILGIIVIVLLIIATSKQYSLLNDNLKALILSYGLPENNFNKAKKFYIFSPIAMGFFSVILIFFVLFFISPPPIIFIVFLIFLLITVVFAILGLIGTIYYGIAIYQCGKSADIKVLLAGGILLILSPGIGAILVYVGLKKLAEY